MEDNFSYTFLVTTKGELVNDLTLRQLEYLVAVADHGTLSRAAQVCHVTPVAIAQALDDVEHKLGERLIIRRRSKDVVVTDIGAAVVNQARRVLREAHRIDKVVESAAGKVAAVVRIGCFPTVASWAIPPIIATFARDYPDVRIELTEGTFRELEGPLNDGHLDLIIGLLTHVTDAVDSTQLSSLRIRLLCSPEHRFARRSSVSLSELAGEDLAIMSAYPVAELLEQLLRDHGVHEGIKWRTSNVDVIKNLVGRNLAVSLVVSPGMLLVSPEGNELRSIDIDDPLPDQGVVVCHARGTTPGPAERAVIAALVALAR